MDKPTPSKTPETDAMWKSIRNAIDSADAVRICESSRSLETRLAAANEKLAESMKALCSLTPGGSEYANDPAACVTYVRTVRESQHETIIQFAARAKAAESALAERGDAAPSEGRILEIAEQFFEGIGNQVVCENAIRLALRERGEAIRALRGQGRTG